MIAEIKQKITKETKIFGEEVVTVRMNLRYLCFLLL
jgi:hypothetical protein